MEDIPVYISLQEGKLGGRLTVPGETKGVILFADSMNAKEQQPDQVVARYVSKQGYATLLFSMLTREEEEIDAKTGEYRQNVGLMAERLATAIDWLGSEVHTRDLGTGIFSSGTRTGVALAAAAQRPNEVKAIVSWQGHPDLAEDSLQHVEAPTLLLVSQNDQDTQALNEEAAGKLAGQVKVQKVVSENQDSISNSIAQLTEQWYAGHLPQPEIN